MAWGDAEVPTFEQSLQQPAQSEQAQTSSLVQTQPQEPTPEDPWADADIVADPNQLVERTSMARVHTEAILEGLAGAAKETAIAGPEAILALATPLITWPLGKVAAGTTGLAGKIIDVDPEELREKMDTVEHAIHEVLDYKPTFAPESAQLALHPVEKVFEVILTPARMADEWLQEKGHPVGGWTVGLAGELATFALIHKAGGKLKNTIVPKPRHRVAPTVEGAKARVNDMLDRLEKQGMDIEGMSIKEFRELQKTQGDQVATQALREANQAAIERYFPKETTEARIKESQKLAQQQIERRFRKAEAPVIEERPPTEPRAPEPRIVEAPKEVAAPKVIVKKRAVAKPKPKEVAVPKERVAVERTPEQNASKLMRLLKRAEKVVAEKGRPVPKNLVENIRETSAKKLPPEVREQAQRMVDESLTKLIERETKQPVPVVKPKKLEFEKVEPGVIKAGEFEIVKTKPKVWEVRQEGQPVETFPTRKIAQSELQRRVETGEIVPKVEAVKPPEIRKWEQKAKGEGLSSERIRDTGEKKIQWDEEIIDREFVEYQTKADPTETAFMESLAKHEGKSVKQIFDDLYGTAKSIAASETGSITIGGKKKTKVTKSEISLDGETVARVKRLNEQAKKAGMTLEQFAESAGFEKSQVAELTKIKNFAKEREQKTPKGFDKKTVKKDFRKEPTKEMADRFTFGVGQAVKRLTRDYIDEFVQHMIKEKRIVEKYKKGSGIVPDRQRPFLKNDRPRVRANAKDLNKLDWARSPHKAFKKLYEVGVNPVVDALEALYAMSQNRQNMKEWALDLTKGIKSAAKDIDRAAEPALKSDRFKRLTEELDKENKRAIHLKKQIEKSGPGIKKSRQDKLRRVNQRIKGLSEKVTETMTKEFDKVIPDLARDHADVRIALHLGEQLPKGIKLSKSELEIANHVKDYFERTGEDLTRVGIPVIRGRGYITHLWERLLEDGGRGVFENVLSSKAPLPVNLAFKHQAVNSRVWFPSVKTILDNYIPLVERKIAFQQFLNKWGEHMAVDLPPRATAFINEWFKKNYYKTAESIPERLTNMAVTYEYARLIGASFSVARKHLFKVSGTASSFGLGTTALGAAKLSKVPVQSLMKKLGREGRTAELDLFRVYVNKRALVRMLDEMPLHANKDRALQVFRDIIGQPTKAIEALDNGISVMAGTLTGLSRGMSYKDVHAAIWDTILDVNFRAGFDQPLWQKHWGARALTMFQSTPFKLMEMKIEMLDGALRGKRDAFGTLHATRLIRFLTIIGAAELIARANDTSVYEEFLHIPFTVTNFNGKHTIPMSPLVQYGVDLHKEGLFNKDVHKKNLEWNVWNKALKFIENQYPTNWYDNRWKHLFGLQSLSKKKQRKKEQELKESGRGRSRRGGRGSRRSSR